MVLVVLLDLAGSNALMIEVESIGFDWLLDDIRKEVSQADFVDTPFSEQIDVACRSMELSSPYHKQSCPFEHEIIAVPRLRQPMEEAFDGILVQE
jgi:hypothetical protein